MATENRLLALPPEVLIRVSSFLITPELGNLRRTCKHVEAALFKDFSKEFFSKRQFMIEEVSLEALVGIANHPTLSKHLSEVIISTHGFTYDANCELNQTRARSERGYASQDVLLQTGRACEMLAEAFSKLPNLKTIGLRDYDGQGRYRDGPNAQWRSYGWSSLGSQPVDAVMSRPFHLVHTKPSAVNSLFPLLLFALGKAQARPSKLEVFLRKDDKMTPACFDVINGFTGHATRPVLAGLKTLMLSIASSPINSRHTSGSVDDGLLYWPLRRFLHHTPNLEMLRLNFDEHQSYADPFLKWLGEDVDQNTTPNAGPDTASVPSVDLPKLRTLDLGMLHAETSTLVKVVTKFNLKAVNLWKVTLHCKDREELNEDSTRWSAFLNEVASGLSTQTRLCHFFIGFPTQAWFSQQMGKILLRVHFSDDTAGPMDGSKTANGPQRAVERKVTFKGGYGSDVKAWLRDVARTARLSETFDQRENLLDSDDDESDEDEDEDEEDDEDMDDDGNDGEE